MKALTDYLVVGSAGFVGAIARYGVGQMVPQALDRLGHSVDFPLGTFVINVTGSFLLGWLMASIDSGGIVSERMRLAVGVGFAGAYTTFSTFMYESDDLVRKGEWIKASANIAGSLFLGLIALRLGAMLAKRMWA